MEAIKDKTKVYLDLSKLSGEEIKEVISLLPEEPFKGAYELYNNYKYLQFIPDSKFGNDRWMVDKQYIDKIEISLSEFRQLFSKGEISDYPGKDYQELFDYFTNQHGLIMLESEMSEIIHIVKNLDKGEEVLKVDNDLLKSSLILLGMFTELDSEIKTQWSQEQINAVQYISDKSNN